MSEQIRELVEARKDAIARGDKALGREIYHQLQGMGVLPQDIDADRVDQGGTPGTHVGSVEGEAKEFETTEAAAPAEKAVKPRARRKKA